MKPQMGLKEKVNVGIDETSKSMKLKESIRVWLQFQKGTYQKIWLTRSHHVWIFALYLYSIHLQLNIFFICSFIHCTLISLFIFLFNNLIFFVYTFHNKNWEFDEYLFRGLVFPNS